MLTDHEKNLVRMMVVNTSPEYMAEVGAMDDETVRARIAEWKEQRLTEINQGIEIYSERTASDTSEINIGGSMKPQDAIIILGQACSSVSTNWEGHMKLQEALKVVSELIPKEKKDETPAV